MPHKKTTSANAKKAPKARSRVKKAPVGSLKDCCSVQNRRNIQLLDMVTCLREELEKLAPRVPHCGACKGEMRRYNKDIITGDDVFLEVTTIWHCPECADLAEEPEEDEVH